MFGGAGMFGGEVVPSTLATGYGAGSLTAPLAGELPIVAGSASGLGGAMPTVSASPWWANALGYAKAHPVQAAGTTGLLGSSIGSMFGGGQNPPPPAAIHVPSGSGGYVPTANSALQLLAQQIANRRRGTRFA